MCVYLYGAIKPLLWKNEIIFGFMRVLSLDLTGTMYTHF